MRHQGDWKKANMAQAETRQLSRPYTTILFCYGGLSLLFAVGLNAAIPDLERGVRLRFNVYVHLLFGIAAILIGLLRLLRGAASLPASNVLSIALAMELPIGTALFLYWLTRVRPGEKSLQLGPKPARWYTAGLFIAALGFSLTALTFRLASASGRPYRLLEIMALAYIGISVLLATVGVARCVSARWGYYATFGLSVVLVLLVPIGTIASIIWFRVVRKSDQELASIRYAEGAA
jgi:hypothetical protein